MSSEALLVELGYELESPGIDRFAVGSVAGMVELGFDAGVKPYVVLG